MPENTQNPSIIQNTLNTNKLLTWTTFVASAVVIIGAVVTVTAGATGFIDTWLNGKVDARIKTLAPVAPPNVQDFSARSSLNAPVSVEMIPVKDGICYLTGIIGYYGGAGEAASIVNNGGVWHLEVKTGRADNSATARCLTFPMPTATE